jgi:hypothetical protein
MPVDPTLPAPIRLAVPSSLLETRPGPPPGPRGNAATAPATAVQLTLSAEALARLAGSAQRPTTDVDPVADARNGRMAPDGPRADVVRADLRPDAGAPGARDAALPGWAAAAPSAVPAGEPRSAARTETAHGTAAWVAEPAGGGGRRIRVQPASVALAALLALALALLAL